MNKNTYKFVVLFLFHIVFIIITYFSIVSTLLQYLCKGFSSHTITLFFHALFCILYFLFLWKDLYSYNYHLFLHPNTIWTFLKNMAISLFIIFLVILISSLVYIFFSSSSDFIIPFKYILIVLLIDIYLFVLLHLFQFFWIVLFLRLGLLKKNVLLAGTPDPRLPLEDFIRETKETKKIIGRLTVEGDSWFFSNSQDEERGSNASRRYTIKEVLDLIASQIVGEIIIFTDRELAGKKLLRLVSYCRENSINYYIVPDTSNLPRKAFWSKRFYHIPLLERWESMRDSLTLMSVKRAIDLMIVAVASLFILPLCLIIACMIKIEDGGPVLYISKRVGKNGKVIKFYKFRTMVKDADRFKKELLAMNERKDGPLFKMHNDPRMTRLGRLLRRLSLDELPQLLNVLRGDISLIGPRPHLVTEVVEYGKKDKLRLECFPGIIGLPQMYGTAFSGFREIVELDLLYRRNWSIHLDLKILAMGLKFVILPFLSRNY